MHSLAPEKAIETLLEPRTLWATLWVGLAVLTVAVLLLVRTRWGQARPLSKCAILSLFAHLLLMGYASMTQLFLTSPAPPRPGYMEIEVVTGDDDQPPQKNRTEASTDPPPWEQLAVDPVEMPEPDQLARATPDFELPDPVADEIPPSPPRARPPTTAVPDPPPPAEVPLTVDTTYQPRTVFPLVEAAKIEEPDVRRRQPSPLVAPAPARLARLPMAAGPSSVPRRELATPPPRDQRMVADRLQRLAQLPPSAETADAVADRADLVASATNRGNTDWQSSDPARVGTAANQPPEMAGGSPTDVPASPVGATPRVPVADSAIRMATTAPSAVSTTTPVPPAAVALSDMYRNRVRLREEHQQLVRTRGGSEETEAAVQAALAWLASRQQADGRFDARAHGGGSRQIVEGENRLGAGTQADTGVTALALLAFLAAGETHLNGTYRENVQHGLEFLLRQQAADGNLGGNATTFAKMYCHGMATLALGESLAMTQDERIRPYLERAVTYTVSAQHPIGGGWRYRPWRYQTDDPGDLSQFGWQLMALKSAEAAGIEVPQRTFTLMRRFLDSCSAGTHGGLASYRPRERVTRPMTAEALASRLFLDRRVNPAAADEAARYLAGEQPGRGRANLYYWYYGTLALFHFQDERWESWNRALQGELLRRQRRAGELSGSWDPDTVWGGCGGRIYCTAMATLCLEVYYRYLPLYGQARRPGE